MTRPTAASLILAAALIAGASTIPLAVRADPVTPVAPPTTVEASALAEAVATGHPVVVDSATTATQIIEALPNGDLRATISAFPQRVQDEGQWRSIDLDLQRRSDGRLEAEVAPEAASLDGGGGTILTRLEEGDNWFELRWPKALPTPLIIGNTATYPEVFPGVDLVATSGNEGFATYVIVKDRLAATNPAITGLGYLWAAAPGLSVSASATDISVTDTHGQVVFAPRVWQCGIPAMCQRPLATAPQQRPPSEATATAANSRLT